MVYTQSQGNFVDLLGKQIDYLKVLELTGTRNDRGNKACFWLCECKCGKKVEKSNRFLQRKNRGIRCCGCRKQELMKEIFDSNYEKTDGCWTWTGMLNKQGYGRIGTKKSAHRQSWIYEYGEIPKGLLICHSCDNPRCVRPSHLFLGSHADNSRDCKNKNRNAKGSKTGTHKLTEDQVLEIRKLRISGKEYQELCDLFGVCWHTILGICKNHHWKHVALGEECSGVKQIRRAPKGSKCGRSKLTEDQVIDMRKLFPVQNCTEIAGKYNVNVSLICKIKNGKNWTHI